MTIKYKIIETDQTRGSIVVNFYDEQNLPDGVSYNIDLEVPLPSIEEIHKIVCMHTPTWLFDREVKLKQGIDMTQVEAIKLQAFDYVDHRALEQQAMIQNQEANVTMIDPFDIPVQVV